MSWIKRNLWFVVSAAVGLLLTGYCAYLLYGALGVNAGVSDDYRATLSSLSELQQKNPYPSKENIKAAQADQERVREFSAEFKKIFAPFPNPPIKDEKGFETYLADKLVQFRAEATNAGVSYPSGYDFGFSGLVGKLNYPSANIQPWMQQLQEVGAILDIVFAAKVNYFYQDKRVPVSSDDAAMEDCLQAASVTNTWGVVTPYQIKFRGFSGDLAAVLEGFARSSNCFIVKAVNVVQDTSAGAQSPVQPVASAPTVTYRMQYAAPAPQSRFRGPNPGGGLPVQPRATMVAVPVAQTAAMNVPPAMILSESPLLITMSVDAVKLKASEP